MTTQDILEVFASIEKPKYASYSNVHGHYGLVVEHKGKGVVVIIAPPRHMNADLIMSKHGGRRNVTVTMFVKNDVEEAIAYLEDDGYMERPLPVEAEGGIAPVHTKEAVTYSVHQSDAKVNHGMRNSDRDINDQTETEAFKRWFGNSEVVNEDGTPDAGESSAAKNFSKNPKKFQKSCFNPPDVCYHSIRRGEHPKPQKQSNTPHRGTIRKWR